MTGTPMIAFVRFNTPDYLVLLVLIPLLILMSFRSLAGLGPIRRIVAIVARCLVLATMVLALADAQRVKTNDNLSVVFAVDRSSSVPSDLQQKAFELIERAAGSAHKNDRIGVVAFDGRGAIEQLPAPTMKIDRIADPLAPDQTDLASALRLGLAMFTGDTARRLVVLSDGNENVGEALEEAKQFSSSGIPIDIVPLVYEHGAEVIFEQLRVPPTAATEETVNLRMVLRSTSPRPVSGQIKLRQNGQPVPLPPELSRVTLNPGPSAFTFPRQLHSSGVHRFEAVFEPDDPSIDAIASNNVGRAFTIVAGQGNILIVTTDANAASSQLLKDALESEKLICELMLVGDQPLSSEFLLGYSLVILDNVPANFVPEQEQQALSVYVREMGGGLMMLGGDESFGAGGWMGSPVEEVMPVSFDIKGKKQIPQGALVLVMHACEIPQGNYIGERVAIAAVKTLSSRDYVGVLAYDWHGVDQQNWTVPFQMVGDKSRIIGSIKSMSMGDLPDLHALMKQGADALAGLSSAGARHMIVISDFDPMFDTSPMGSGTTLLKKMRDNNISCTTISIGWGGHMIDTRKANAIAQGAAKGGKHYPVKDFSKLPQIFIKEARIVQRSLIQDVPPFEPKLVSLLSPAVAGLAGQQLPRLTGYVIATAKPLADVALVRTTEDRDNDPILATWQAGLGRTVAFTSGMWPRWGVEWSAWPRFSNVFAQLARWASRQSEAAAFDVSTSIQGSKARVRIDALDKNAATIENMNIQGTLIAPDNSVSTLRLSQTGPGRYEGEFTAHQAGSYVINMLYQMGQGDNIATGTLQTGVSVAYSPEYRELAANLSLLDELRQRTNGRNIDPSRPATVFDRAGLAKAESRMSIWEDLVRLALLLFLLDVAVRRIAINPLELARKARRLLSELAGGRQRGETSAAVLTTLKGTRERVREDISTVKRPEAGTPPSRDARYEAPTPDRKATEDLSKALGGASETDQPVVARPTRKPAPTSEKSYTSRLLEAKKRARQKREDEDK
ncbi:MAG: VWA domain-containing protein [Phycisphaerae bacterium]|nr:VWA domain-containing protein [Phycisphaerae bacterium]